MLEYYKIKSTKELPYDEAVTIIQRETKKWLSLTKAHTHIH
jgi:hypothetical protein